MNTDKIYPSKYLKSGDVTETPRSYTISGAEIEEVGREKTPRLVLSLKGEDKGFVVNKTNMNTIAKALGSKETEDWIGKAIKLYSTEVQLGDEMVEAIRVSLKPGLPAGIGGPSEDVPGRQKQDGKPKLASTWDESEEPARETPF